MICITKPPESVDLCSLVPNSKQGFVTSNSVISIPIISVWQCWGRYGPLGFLISITYTIKNLYYITYIAELDSGISISIQWWILLFVVVISLHHYRSGRHDITFDRHKSSLRLPHSCSICLWLNSTLPWDLFIYKNQVAARGFLVFHWFEAPKSYVLNFVFLVSLISLALGSYLSPISVIQKTKNFFPDFRAFL